MTLTPVGSLFLRQHFDFPLPSPLKVFEMLVVPEQEYPLVCVAISQGTEPGQVVRFETINLNSCSSWFTEMGTSKSNMYLDVDTNSKESIQRHIVVCGDMVDGGETNLSIDSSLHRTQCSLAPLWICHWYHVKYSILLQHMMTRLSVYSHRLKPKILSDCSLCKQHKEPP